MSIQEQAPSNLPERNPDNYRYHEVAVRDIFETTDHERITESLKELESMGFYGNTSLHDALTRKRLSTIDYENPATQELIKRVPGVEHWLALVPTPRALGPLYNPDTIKLPDGHVIGDELRNWMIEIADARGLRYRSQMVTNLLVEGAAGALKRGEGRQKWLSVASGAAQPLLKAAQEIDYHYGEAPDMTLVDLSTQALKDAQEYARELGVDADLRVERMNVLRRQGLDERVGLGEIAVQHLFNRHDRSKLSRERLSQESYDIVEAIGILEYMKPDDWTYRYNGVVNLKTVQAGAKTFLENSYRMVKPGGDLIVGNMLDTHPQLGFTLNTIQWPHIQPRSIDQMMKLFDEVGLGTERDVYVPSDAQNQVYALYKIHKPNREGK